MSMVIISVNAFTKIVHVKGRGKIFKTVLSFRKSLMRPTCICFWENLNASLCFP